MQQNPQYFPEYFSKDRKIDIQVMDRMLLERCSAWIDANDALTREAAFHEYIDTVIGVIELDGQNPRHRHDVQEQALSTIDVLVSRQGATQETRMYMRLQFLNGFAERLLDRKYENTFVAPNPEVGKRRTQLRETFQTILDVDQSVFNGLKPRSHNLPAPQSSTESNDQIQPDATHIHIEFTNAGQGRMFGEALGKNARQKHWKIEAVYNQVEGKNTLEIYPTNLGNILQTANPHDALRSALQPVEDYLAAKGYTAGTMTTDTSKGNIVQWQEKQAE